MDIVIGTIMTIDQAGMQGGHLPPARDRGVAAGHAPLPPHPHRPPDVSGALPEQFGQDTAHF